jgi:hypothetical protein
MPLEPLHFPILKKVIPPTLQVLRCLLPERGDQCHFLPLAEASDV